MRIPKGEPCMHTMPRGRCAILYGHIGLMLLLGIQVIALAQTTDIVPPTAPTNIRAAVYPDRIDLQWDKATDDAGVTAYQVWRDGAPVATVTTLLYHDRWIAPSTTYTYAVKAIDGTGNGSELSRRVRATSQPAPPPPPAGPIHVPLRQWIALKMPPQGAIPGVSKHVTGAFNPDDGRIYFTGGDYGGPVYLDSYRQETYSLSLAARWADKANPHAGWRLEYPYCGPAGQVQPQSPDFVGWIWDSKRHVFWFVPGVSVRARKTCLNMTGEKNDPNFPFARVMTFEPVAKRWTDVAAGGRGTAHTWHSVYDPATDTIIQFSGAGNGAVTVGTYHIDTTSWTYRNVAPPNWDRKTIRITAGYLATDFKARIIYTIDPNAQRLYRYSMESQTLEALGELPVPNREGQPKIVWDPINEVLFWHNGQVNEFFAYHPTTRTWEQLSTQSDLPDIHAVASNTLVFDPHQNVLLTFGEVWGAPGTPQHAAKPYMFLYRYGPGSGPVDKKSAAQ